MLYQRGPLQTRTVCQQQIDRTQYRQHTRKVTKGQPWQCIPFKIQIQSWKIKSLRRQICPVGLHYQWWVKILHLFKSTKAYRANYIKKKLKDNSIFKYDRFLGLGSASKGPFINDNTPESAFLPLPLSVTQFPYIF